jgi:hypothetical protein
VLLLVLVPMGLEIKLDKRKKIKDKEKIRNYVRKEELKEEGKGREEEGKERKGKKKGKERKGKERRRKRKRKR